MKQGTLFYDEKKWYLVGLTGLKLDRLEMRV